MRMASKIEIHHVDTNSANHFFIQSKLAGNQALFLVPFLLLLPPPLSFLIQLFLATVRLHDAIGPVKRKAISIYTMENLTSFQ